MNNFNLITHDMLVKQAKRWLETNSKLSCGVVLAEYRCYANSIPDVIGFNADRSIVIECKISRSDFLADKHKPHRGYVNQLGNKRFYFVLPHILSAEDIPEDWGLIYAGDKRVTIVKDAPYHTEPTVKVAEYSILYSIARRANIKGFMNEITKPLPKFDSLGGVS